MATTGVDLPAPVVVAPVGRRRSRVGHDLIVALLVGAMLFSLAPVYVMVANGLKDKSYLTLSDMGRLPRDPSGRGFGAAFAALRPNLWNSVAMAVPATLLSGLLGTITCYPFWKWTFRGSDVVFTLVLFGMCIPYRSILMPMIETLQELGLYGSRGGLILVHVIDGLPITTLIFRNYLANVPSELVAAARIDGAGVIGTFRRIMLPLSLPAYVVVGVFQFTSIWNDFLFGVTVVFSPARQPITVALNNLSGTNSVDWTVVMAGAVVVALPTALISVLLGRFFIRGLLAGSMKG